MWLGSGTARLGQGTMLSELEVQRTIRQENYASIEYVAHFHMHVVNRNDRDEHLPKRNVSWHFAHKKRECRKHTTERL